MVVLDTDHFSLLEWETSPQCQRLLERLGAAEVGEPTVTIISFEEQMRGWMACIAKQREASRQIDAYRRLHRQLKSYCAFKVLDYDERAAVEWKKLSHQRIRIGALDLKIAAIAIANDATLLTRNLRDFDKVPGLKVDDWTK